MTSRHDRRLHRGPSYYSSHHYQESKEAQMEQKIEAKIEFFCNKLKYAFLWRLRRKKNGQD